MAHTKAWDGSRLVNVDNDDTRRGIGQELEQPSKFCLLDEDPAAKQIQTSGPSPYAAKTGDATLTLRQYNMRLKASAKDIFHDVSARAVFASNT